ncbi:hypothetical protein [Brochothrix thermosphacta]|uniref:hypothetical protein n=1 Tax=Brochothrix thermosphacta TaxID=2756 RepID=UPI0039AEED49
MDDLIKSGQITLEHSAHWTIIFKQLSSILIMLIAVIILFSLTVFFKKFINYFVKRKIFSYIISSIIFLAATGVFLTVYINAMVESENMNQKVLLAEKWKKEKGIPYINNLPLQQQLLFSYEEVKGKVSADNFIDSSTLLPTSIPGRTDENDANLIDSSRMVNLIKGERVKFTYALDGQLVSETGWTSVHFQPNESFLFLSWDNDRYITFKRLPKDIGNGLNAGIYDIKIYLPHSDLEKLFRNKVPDVKVSSDDATSVKEEKK